MVQKFSMHKPRLHNKIIKLLLFYYVKLEKLFSARGDYLYRFTPFP